MFRIEPLIKRRRIIRDLKNMQERDTSARENSQLGRRFNGLFRMFRKIDRDQELTVASQTITFCAQGVPLPWNSKRLKADPADFWCSYSSLDACKRNAGSFLRLFRPKGQEIVPQSLQSSSSPSISLSSPSKLQRGQSGTLRLLVGKPSRLAPEVSQPERVRRDALLTEDAKRDASPTTPCSCYRRQRSRPLTRLIP